MALRDNYRTNLFEDYEPVDSGVEEPLGGLPTVQTTPIQSTPIQETPFSQPVANSVEQGMFAPQTGGLPTTNSSAVNTATEDAPMATTPQPELPVAKATTPDKSEEIIANLSSQILGQNTTSNWSGEGFGSAEANAKDMAKILSGIGITDIKDFGKITKTVPGYSYETEQGTVDVPEQTITTYGNKVTGQEVPNTYSERQTGNFFGGTFSGKGNTGYGVQFDAQGNPYFYTQGASSSDIGNIAPLLAVASFIPGVAPFAQALNAAIAIKNNDIVGGLASIAGLGGYTDVSTGLRVAKALDSGDASGVITALMQNPTVSNVAGSTMLTDTISLKDASNALNVANNVSNGNYAGALSSAGMLTGSKDMATAGAAIKVVNAINSGNEVAIINAIGGLNNTINAGNNLSNKDVASGLANNVANVSKTAPLSEADQADLTPDQLNVYQAEGTQGLIDYNRANKNMKSLTGTEGYDYGGDTAPYNTPSETPPSGLNLASLSGTTSDAGNGLIEVSGTPIFSGSEKASAVRPPAGYALASQDDPVMDEPARYDENDRLMPKSDGTYYDITQNAWFKPTGEFDLSKLVGGLDSLEENTSDEDANGDNLTVVGELPKSDVPQTTNDNELTITADRQNNQSVLPSSATPDQGTLTTLGDTPTSNAKDEGTMTIVGDRPTSNVTNDGGLPRSLSPTSDEDTVTVTGDLPRQTPSDSTVIKNDDGTTTTVTIVDNRPVIHTCAEGYHWDEASQSCVPDQSVPEVVVTAPPTVTSPDVTTPPVVTKPPVVTPPSVTTPPVVKKPTTSSPLASMGTAIPKLDSSPQFLGGASPQKRMQLAKLQQLFASLTPEMAAILTERGFAPPKYKEETSEEKPSEKSDESVFGNLSDELYNPKSKFMASGGTVLESMMPKFIESQKMLSGAPVSGTSGMDAPLKLSSLKFLKQAIANPPKPMGGLAQGGLPEKYAKVAPKGHKPEFITGLTGYYAQGDGTGQSDDIPAMLHDGDYVIDADAVAALGDGSSKAGAEALSQFQSKIPHKMSTGGQAVPAKIADGEYVFPEAFVTAIGGGDNKEGAKRLDAMREELRAHKRSAPTSKIPPKAKSPLDYLRMAKG